MWNLKYYIDRKTFKRPNRNDPLVVRALGFFILPENFPSSLHIYSFLARVARKIQSTR